MRPSLPFLSVLIIALATLSAGSTLNAVPQDSAGSGPQPARQPFNVDFPGGSGAEYIAAIRKAVADANIVVLAGLDQITIPPVRLHNVDVASALGVLQSLPSTQAVVNIKEILHDGDRSPVFTITAWVKGADKPTPDNLQTTVISMADLLGENLKPADALKAIETALELIKGDHDPAQIRFHEETGLLIARGSPEQIESIRQVIDQLHERTRTFRQKQHQATEATRRENISAQLQSENQRLHMDGVRAETRAQLLEQEVAKLQAVISELENEIRMLNAERADLARKAQENKPNPDN